MHIKPHTTLDIPKSGNCPNCGELHNDWIGYVRPGQKEIGVFCPVCYTHFKDEELSFEEFGFNDGTVLKNEFYYQS